MTRLPPLGWVLAPQTQPDRRVLKKENEKRMWNERQSQTRGAGASSPPRRWGGGLPGAPRPLLPLRAHLCPPPCPGVGLRELCPHCPRVHPPGRAACAWAGDSPAARLPPRPGAPLLLWRSLGPGTCPVFPPPSECGREQMSPRQKEKRSQAPAKPLLPRALGRMFGENVKAFIFLSTFPGPGRRK